MFDKVVRHFYDDTCVVPEKVEGESSPSAPDTFEYYTENYSVRSHIETPHSDGPSCVL